MKGLVVVLLSTLVLGPLPCAGQVLPLDPVSCDEPGSRSAARMAMHFINRHHHHHGYKFKLSDVRTSTGEKAGTADCKLHLELDLVETKCHTVNPKHFEECEVRDYSETQVKADCNVTLSIAEGNGTVNKYTCNTKPVSAEEVTAVCPDCNVLLPLHNPEGLESVMAALRQFNMDSNQTSYFKLIEVGRLSSGYMMTMGMSYYAEFTIVETRCPAKARIDPQACVPLPPHEAHRGFCESSRNGIGEVSVDCQIFEALNLTFREPNQRPRGPQGPQGPDAAGRKFGDIPGLKPIKFPFPRCHGFVTIPPSIHPICPFPPHHGHPLPHHPPHGPPPGHVPPPGHGLPPAHGPPRPHPKA